MSTATKNRRAWIDARHPMVNERLWGLTLLERNIRELDLIGIRELIVSITSEADPRRHFCHAVSNAGRISFVVSEQSKPFDALLGLLESGSDLVLALQGHLLNDRRLLRGLLALDSAGALVLPSGDELGSVSMLSATESALFAQAQFHDLSRILQQAIDNGAIPNYDLSSFNPYVKNLRREIKPYLLPVSGPARLEEADKLLRLTVHKGVLEFVAKVIHPPLEFGAARYLACTSVTPNLVTMIWLILAGITVPLFGSGQILLGTILAAISGIMDGIDGKLARLTLRFSKSGDLLDHIGGTLYDAVWYLALGWHFTSGDPSSVAGSFTLILFFAYIVERIVPGIFRKIHGVEIYDYADIDKLGRLIGSRMNNNIWLLMIGSLIGQARGTFYVISVWMLLTAFWHTLRLIQVTALAKLSRTHPTRS